MNTSREALRLELVRLTYSHGRDAAEAVGRARELEKYLLEPVEELTGAGQAPEKRAPGRPRKNDREL